MLFCPKIGSQAQGILLTCYPYKFIWISLSLKFLKQTRIPGLSGHDCLTLPGVPSLFSSEDLVSTDFLWKAHWCLRNAGLLIADYMGVPLEYDTPTKALAKSTCLYPGMSKRTDTYGTHANKYIAIKSSKTQ